MILTLKQLQPLELILYTPPEKLLTPQTFLTPSQKKFFTFAENFLTTLNNSHSPKNS